MKKILATLAAVVFSTSTFAADLSQVSIGISGNYGLYGADGKEENYTHTGTLERTTKKDGAAFLATYAPYNPWLPVIPIDIWDKSAANVEVEKTTAARVAKIFFIIVPLFNIKLIYISGFFSINKNN